MEAMNVAPADLAQIITKTISNLNYHQLTNLYDQFLIMNYEQKKRFCKDLFGIDSHELVENFGLIINQFLQIRV